MLPTLSCSSYKLTCCSHLGAFIVDHLLRSLEERCSGKIEVRSCLPVVVCDLGGESPISLID